jgi:hypothetical protein
MKVYKNYTDVYGEEAKPDGDKAVDISENVGEQDEAISDTTLN